MRVALPGFTVQAPEIADDGLAARVAAESKASHVIETAYLEPDEGKGEATPASCRDLYQSRPMPAALRGTKGKTADRPGMAVMSSLVETYDGKPLMQENVHAYLAHAHACADVHVSKAQYSDADWPLFEKVLATLRVEDDAP